jgi:hypothetical protein
MVYLGPIQPRPNPVKAPSRPSSTTAVTAYANEHQKDDHSAGLEAIGPPGGVERRKQDRRNKSGAAMLETRAGKDRRKSPQPSISITI